MGSSDNCRHSRSISSTILRGAKLHDDEAWARLHAVWHPVVYAWCRRAGVAPHDAEEIVQNVFLKASRGIEGFERQSFRAWIGAITRNTIADHYRNSRNCPVAIGGSGSWIANVEDKSVPDNGEVGFNFPGGKSTEPAPEDSEPYLVHQLLAVIRKDFEHATFEAFRRTVMDDRRPVDVAKELGITPEAVRAAKYRVLKRLREESPITR